MSRSIAPSPREFNTLLALATIALFLLLHPYRGLTHDGRLYTIQALSHLQPELYGNDIFVRLGSQDSYTIFSPIYAWLISSLGVEHAAATITLASLCLFLAAAWMLARALLPPTQAAVALLMILIIPAYYGASRVFYYLEGFITPRQLSEALTLFCLVAWCKGRHLLAAALSAAALLLHPIIGLAGVALLITLRWGLPHLQKLWPLVIAAALLSVLGLSGWVPITRWQFDAEWYEIVRMRTYLFLLNWDSEDWSRVVTVLATLAIAGLSLGDKLRQVALATLIVSGSMLLVALIGGDLLHITLIVQAQPWRVMWLATVLAILLLPPIASRGWHLGTMGKCSFLLLAASWVSSQSMIPLVAAPIAVLSMSFGVRSIQIEPQRWLMAGAWIVLAIACWHAAATAQLSWESGLRQVETLPPQLDRFLTLCQNGLVPALLLLAAFYVIARFPSKLTMATLTTLTIVAIASVAVPAARTWTLARYTKEVHDVFAEWRTHIPPGSDVMWASYQSGGGDDATNSWLLLERPNFVSATQAPNALFSRAAAIEMRSRAQQLWGLLPFTDPFRPKGANESKPTGPLRLAPLCAASSVRYIVTTATFVDAAPMSAPKGAPSGLRSYKLYTCT